MIKEIEIVPKQYLKKLVGTNNLWEIRIKQGNSQIRILCFFKDNNFIILTSGFIKKTKKTPKKEIDVAKKRMIDYFNRIKK